MGAHAGQELDRISRVLFPSLFFFLQALAYLLRSADLDMFKVVLFLILVCIILGLILHIKLKRQRLPGQLWVRGWEKSLNHADIPTFNCLDENEIEVIFKAIDR